MRKWIAALCALSLGATTPLYAATTTASSTTSVVNTTAATAGPGGFSNSSSFGLGGTIVTAAPNSSSTSSFEANQTRGLAIGNASFSGMTRVQTNGFGLSTP